MLLELLPKITGFSDVNFSIDEVIAEFHTKFADTVMFVNDELVYIRKVSSSQEKSGEPFKYFLEIYPPRRLAADQVKNLSAFKPVCGLYWINDTKLINFRKTAKKQYKKSFCYGENYVFDIFDLNKQYDPGEFDITLILNTLSTELLNSKKQGLISSNRQLALYNGNIIFRTSKIGTYTTPHTYYLTCEVSKGFEQEVIDFISKEAL